MVCPPEYKEFSKTSKYCYRIVNEKETWNGAKEKCQEDGGELACFSSAQERDNLANECTGQCWVGYIWKNGEFERIQFIRISNKQSTTLNKKYRRKRY